MASSIKRTAHQPADARIHTAGAEESKRATVRAVQRAFALLGCLGADHRVTTLSQLARQSRLPISTAARLLATLEETGFVERDARGYAPGVQLARIGLGALRRFAAHLVSERHLRRLVTLTGETANLAVKANESQAVYLRQVYSTKSLRHASWIGKPLPMTTSASGAALRGLVGNVGYAARRDMVERGFTAIAAPIYDASGEIVAAISVAGPSSRIDNKTLARIGRVVVEQARLASSEMVQHSRDDEESLLLKVSRKRAR